MNLRIIEPIKQPRMAVAQIQKNVPSNKQFPFFKIKDGEDVSIRFLDWQEPGPTYFTHDIDIKELKAPCKALHCSKNPATEYVSMAVVDEAGIPQQLVLKKSSYERIVKLAENIQNEHIFIRGWNFLTRLAKQLWCRITGKEIGVRKFTILQ
jgi:hypothetical protein